MGISTHVLDTSLGRPAGGIEVALDREEARDLWTEVARGVTDREGRVALLGPRESAPAAGVYRLHFETGAYFTARGADALFPFVEIVFNVLAGEPHYHVPLLLSANGYTTYRGS